MLFTIKPYKEVDISEKNDSIFLGLVIKLLVI